MKHDMRSELLRIATCQFAVSRDIQRNAAAIGGYVRAAKKAGADVVHFPECALSGYAGVDFPSFGGYDWGLLRNETLGILELTGKLGLWVVLGSTHPLTSPNKPHNSLYLIGLQGKIIDRYDKRFCMAREMKHFTPGDHFVLFTVKGVKCSLLVCFDLRFPELYRQLYKQGVQCVLQSFYNARQKGPSVHSHIMRQTMQAHAAANHFWVSMANASAYYQPYPSCFIQPDGVIARQLRANRPGMMVNTVDLSREFYDPMVGFRDMAIAGALSSGAARIGDPRSTNTRAL